MGLKNMSLSTGSTPSVAGGSAIVFADDGVTIQNGVHLVVPATADFRVREQSTWKYRPPVLLSDGTYRRDKRTVSYTVPRILADGKIVNDVIRLERECHPETSAADVLDMNVLACQMLFDTDTTNFWTAGSLS